VHTCSFDSPENNLDFGHSFHVVPLHFASGTVNIGAMICFDREFPESARTLMLKGAEIILTPNSCSMQYDSLIGDIRFQQLRARAFENMLGIALVNYPKPKNDGHSCAINVDGQPIVLAQENEEICLASFDLNRIRKWQQDEVWGAKHRHPQSYSN
jgi:5-aminopentanamidase